ncbi:MAG: DUF2290 domain-containing protein [Alcaligenaceae bacterium]|nr:MAG: DUF2290 domain-containing protein [Alcaligenaceae bacterium]
MSCYQGLSLSRTDSGDRKIGYADQWRKAREENWFHLLLADQSFFLFSEENDKLSYSFFPCPLDIPTFSNFLASLDRQNSQRNRAEYADQYQLVVETADLKAHITPIRFDQDLASYRACTHPAAHLHIGLENEIRIAVRRHLTPLAFVLFVIRQHYPQNWDQLMLHGDELKLHRRVREDLTLVPDERWSAVDEMQTYMH